MRRPSNHKARQIDLKLIDPPSAQIRMEISEAGVLELASSISVIGLLQPILVRPAGERYEIVFGHRRYLACIKLNWKRIQAVVRHLDDATVALMRGTENIARDDLSPIEEAAVYADLRDNHGLSVDQISKHMAKSPGIVARRLDLLKMPPQLQEAVHHRQISYGVAEELWRITDISKMEYFLGYAIEHGVTVVVARGWVKDWRDQTRRAQSDIGGGLPGGSPLASRPVWVACDVCAGPMELGTEIAMRCCPDCAEKLKKALAGQGP